MLRLFVTPRTVGAHLTAVYIKRGVDNRAAASRLACYSHPGPARLSDLTMGAVLRPRKKLSGRTMWRRPPLPMLVPEMSDAAPASVRGAANEQEEAPTMSAAVRSRSAVSHRVKTTLAAGVLALSLSFGVGGFVNHAAAERVQIGPGASSLTVACRALQDAFIENGKGPKPGETVDDVIAKQKELVAEWKTLGCSDVYGYIGVYLVGNSTKPPVMAPTNPAAPRVSTPTPTRRPGVTQPQAVPSSPPVQR